MARRLGGWSICSSKYSPLGSKQCPARPLAAHRLPLIPALRRLLMCHAPNQNRPSTPLVMSRNLLSQIQSLPETNSRGRYADWASHWQLPTCPRSMASKLRGQVADVVQMRYRFLSGRGGFHEEGQIPDNDCGVQPDSCGCGHGATSSGDVRPCECGGRADADGYVGSRRSGRTFLPCVCLEAADSDHPRPETVSRLAQQQRLRAGGENQTCPVSAAVLLLLRSEHRAQESPRLLRQRARFAVRHLPKRSRARLSTDAKGKDAGADSRGDHSWRLEIGGHEALHDPLDFALGLTCLPRSKLKVWNVSDSPTSLGSRSC